MVPCIFCTWFDSHYSVCVAENSLELCPVLDPTQRSVASELLFVDLGVLGPYERDLHVVVEAAIFKLEETVGE